MNNKDLEKKVEELEKRIVSLETGRQSLRVVEKDFYGRPLVVEVGPVRK